jgi:hypothetical protein
MRYAGIKLITVLDPNREEGFRSLDVGSSYLDDNGKQYLLLPKDTKTDYIKWLLKQEGMDGVIPFSISKAEEAK